jgi:hypothetical protein
MECYNLFLKRWSKATPHSHLILMVTGSHFSINKNVPQADFHARSDFSLALLRGGFVMLKHERFFAKSALLRAKETKNGTER